MNPQLTSSIPTIQPVLYEITDSKSGEFKGCMLGTCHDVRILQKGLTLQDLPQFFEVNSQVQKCFSKAQKLLLEIDPEKEIRYLAEAVVKERMNHALPYKLEVYVHPHFLY